MDKFDRAAEEITPRLKLENALDSTPATPQSEVDRTYNLTKGSVVGDRYTVIDFIGRGGMGTVHRVEQNSSGKQFALKLLNDGFFSPQEIARFQKESRAASMLDHPNIVRAVDSGMLNDEIPYFVMELVQGETLAERLKRLGRLSMQDTLKILIQACFALDYAHKNRIVHRDLKPGNIILLGEGQSTTIRIVDFGIAKLIDTEESQSLTATGQVLGSPLYMSPEQCRGSTIDHRADIYSMGCLAFEIVTGRPPFIGDTALATMMMHLSQEPPSLKEASLGLEFSPIFEKIIRRALEKEPNERYQSLGEMVKDLLTVDLRLDSEPEKNNDQNLPATKSPHRILVSVIGGIIAGAVFITLIFYPDKTRQSPSKINDTPVITKSDGPELEKKRNSFLDVTDDATPELRLLVATIERYNKSLIVNEKKVPTKWLSILAKKCPNIEVMSFTASQFSSRDLSALEHFPLKVLDLSETNVTDDVAPYLAKLKSLEELRLNNTQVSDLTVRALSKLQRLQILQLRHTKNITDKGISALLELPQLRVIQLSRTNVSDEGVKTLSQLPNLIAIGIAYTHVTPECIPYLCRLKKLEYLALEGNQALNYADIHRLCKALPALKQIRVAGCSLRQNEDEALAKRFPKITFEDQLF